MKITDAKGREWTVERRFAPWRRVLRLFALAAGRYNRWPPRDGSRGYLDAEGQLVVFVYGVLLGVILLPVTLLELLALAVAGWVLAGLRAAGRARYRIDVIGYDGGHVYSATVLLTKDPDRLVEALTTQRRGAEHAFRPAGLPDGVEVRSHRSLWQSTAEWV
jgi:hypothetical protein